MSRTAALAVLGVALVGCLGLLGYAGWWLSRGTTARPAPLQVPLAGTLTTASPASSPGSTATARPPTPGEYAGYLRQVHDRARGVLRDYNERYPQESGAEATRKAIRLAREQAERAQALRRELQAHPPPPEAARAWDALDRFLENTAAQLETTASQQQEFLSGASPDARLQARSDELFRRKEALFREMEEELRRLP